MNSNPAETELLTLRSLARFLVSLDDPRSESWRSITLTQIVEMAREALEADDRRDDPIETGMEAALGDARETIRQLRELLAEARGYVPATTGTHEEISAVLGWCGRGYCDHVPTSASTDSGSRP